MMGDYDKSNIDVLGGVRNSTALENTKSDYCYSSNTTVR